MKQDLAYVYLYASQKKQDKTRVFFDMNAIKVLGDLFKKLILRKGYV